MGRALECAIDAGELRCHVEEKGFDAMVARLAIEPSELLSALRGRRRLSIDQAIALRLDVDLMPFERAEVFA